MTPPHASQLTWLRTGREGLSAMLEAIHHARVSVGLEIYILQDCEIGARFREALRAAAARGVRVRVLIDAFGSIELPADYLNLVSQAGGDCRWFNPLELGRLPYRDHRKMLVIDDEVALVGGFNIGTDYDGDGVTHGWRDLGVVARGAWVMPLVQAFHGMFGAASFRHARLSRFRRHLVPQKVTTALGDLFLLSPGLGRNPARESLVQDMSEARRVRLTTAYFFPPGRLRRALGSVVRRGGTVQVLLPGRSDVKFAQMAARGHYARLLKAGVEIHEYQSSVLHAKRYLLDDVVYVGSANLDLRSLNINYEILLRTVDAGLAAEGHAQFEEDLRHSLRITTGAWKLRPWWNRLAERLASVVLGRFDLRLAMRQLYRLRVAVPRRKKRQRKGVRRAGTSSKD
jgi:cardiolipin synthase